MDCCGVVSIHPGLGYLKASLNEIKRFVGNWPWKSKEDFLKPVPGAVAVNIEQVLVRDFEPISLWKYILDPSGSFNWPLINDHDC